MKIVSKFLPVIFITLIVFISGCATTDPDRGKKTGIGAGILTGAILGNNVGDGSRENQILGMIFGGIIGGAIGAQQDQMRKEIRAQGLENLIDVVPIDENSFRVVIPDSRRTGFAFDSAGPSQGLQNFLVTVAKVAKMNVGTSITVEGHTDSVGKDSYNMDLGHRRAMAVRDALTFQGVQNSIRVETYGEHRPVATNETVVGRQQNRRVEIIFRQQ